MGEEAEVTIDGVVERFVFRNEDTSFTIARFTMGGEHVTVVGELGTKTVSGDVFRAVFNAGKPASDPSMRGTLFDTAPIP